tara:strand:- start:145 stop:1224 length:1080 start_codon:yes stop_codon:yes gene_type:complete
MRLKILSGIEGRDYEVDVRVPNRTLTEQEFKEYNIRANKNTGEFDFDILSSSFEYEDLQDWGFSDDELTDFTLDLIDDDDSGDDVVPDKPVEARSQLGDLYELGSHRVLCGDSTDKEIVAALMNGDKADMVFTDPPYGVSIGDKNKLLDSIEKAERITTNIKNDTMSPDDLKEMLTMAFSNVKSVSHDKCSYYVTAPQGGELGMMMLEMLRDAGLAVRHVIIWVKNRQCFSMGRLDYEYKHEPILYTWNKSHEFYGNGKHKNSVWEIDKEQSCNLHPTMKPVELIENAVLNSSKKSSVILDPFLGSGSTLIACEKTKRRCYGMELDPQYVDVIVQRYVDYTGNNKIRLNGEDIEWGDGG